MYTYRLVLMPFPQASILILPIPAADAYMITLLVPLPLPNVFLCTVKYVMQPCMQ
jgi:hypothetical protein